MEKEQGALGTNGQAIPTQCWMSYKKQLIDFQCSTH